MNESEFERLARDAAAGVRAQADLIADSDGALAQLLMSEAGAVSETGRTSDAPGVDTRPERCGRSPWVPLLIAAASVAAVAGIVLVVRGDSPETIVSTSEPDVPTPSEVDVAPDTAPVATEQASTGQATTTAPPDTTIVPPGDLIVNVPDEYGPQLTRTVLATYGRGDGPDDLGYESCQECEPLTPFAPIVTDDGTVFVADADNERWQIFRSGVWMSLLYRPGEVVTATPVVGPDGLIYASVADDLPGRSGLRIVSYDPATMDVVASYPVAESVYLTVDLVNEAIEFGRQRIHPFDAPIGTPTWNVLEPTGLVTLSLSGIQRQFQLPVGWRTNDTEVKALEDGSIVLRVDVLAADNSSPEWLLVRLWPDGTSATGTLGGRPSTTNFDGRFTDTGYVQLEDAIVEYAFPTFAGVDPLAGWNVPTFEAPDLAAVPRLLPQQPVPGVVSTVRSEGADSPNESPSYTQTWVRSGAQGAVDAIAQIETRFEPRLPTDTTAADAEIAGWPRSYFAIAVPPVEILNLYSATRSMTFWTSGLDASEVQVAARSLEVDVDGIGWAVPPLPDPDRWTLVHEGWSSGTASRTIVQRSPDDTTYLEMSTMAGAPEAIGAPGFLFSTIALGSIDGRPALLFDREGGSSAITWSPSDGVVVVFGSYGPLDQLLTIAESVVEVDRAAWEAASTVDTSRSDGCNSMFC